MKNRESRRLEQEPRNIQSLGEFDKEYFIKLEGSQAWNALDQSNCKNQRYFTVYGTKGEKLGIVGIYDTDEDTRLTHTIVDPLYRGQGLAGKFKERLMNELNLSFITMTIDHGNTASINAAEKLDNVTKVSDAEYEKKFHKVKYVYKKT